jgi:hypothetical protein
MKTLLWATEMNVRGGNAALRAAADAEAICEAVRRPTMRFVAQSRLSSKAG